MQISRSLPFVATMSAIVALAVPQAFAQSVVATVPPEYEEPPTLDAAAILLPAFQHGAHFTVRSEVPTYAGVNDYVIDSDFGVFTASGNTELIERVQEIHAIAKLREVSRTDEYKTALKTAATSPIKLAKNLAARPVKTISGVPKGIWKFLNRTGQSIKELGEEHEHSPYDEGAGKDLIGFTDAKRKLAIRLGVDPYSMNETMQRELNGISWASFAGSMTVTVALAPVGGAAGTAITAVNLTSSNLEILRDNDPTDLRRINLGKLLKMEVPREDAVSFLNSPAYSPTNQTLLVGALATLGDIAGQSEFIRLANQASGEGDAIFFRRCAQVMAKVNQEIPLTAISAEQSLPICLARDGTLVIPLEWDYACWTETAAALMEKMKHIHFGDHKVGAHHAFITGQASPKLKEVLAANGIELSEKYLPGPLQ